MATDPTHVIISKRTPLQDKYSKLFAMFLTFFVSTIFLLIPLFYQAITNRSFFSHDIIIGFFFVGLYGYGFIIAILLSIFVREYGGKISKYYTDNPRLFENLFIIFLIASLALIFIIVPDLGIGSVIGSLAAAILTWILNRRDRQNSNSSP